jgi:hypothetical protein
MLAANAAHYTAIIPDEFGAVLVSALNADVPLKTFEAKVRVYELQSEHSRTEVISLSSSPHVMHERRCRCDRPFASAVASRCFKASATT